MRQNQFKNKINKICDEERIEKRLKQETKLKMKTESRTPIARR